ncbi:MAG: sigma 54-interacting transcriptional regulator [Desulfosarcinaceae bacterium]|nr:sigma 54-interacting transcriptional regulator [Desulfosarcinaceae bacterium]
MRDKELNIDTVLSPAYRQIWDNSLLGIMVLDSDGIVRYINRLLIRTDDLQDADILGKKMVDFYPMEKERHVSIRTIKSGKPIIKKTILYYSHKNKLVNSLISTFPLYSKGEVEGVIHFSLNLQISQRLIERHECQEPPLLDAAPLQEKETYTFASLIGDSPKFRNAVTYAKSNSQTDFSALIWAETGCGKELFAQSMHHASARHDKPFIPINCAAIPDNLLEATLFGTAKGAFTGAIEKAGLLENAQGGTLLLDELNSMSLELQAKLLRVIQEKKIRRVGALREKPIDVKFISTCNIPPSQALETNKIRMDLFYRLAVVVIEIPPLRQRRTDIPLLSRYFLDQWAVDSRQPTVDISDAVDEMFDRYPWPGNVRELEHTLKSSLSVLHGERTIRRHHLSSYFTNNYHRVVAGDTGQNTDGVASPPARPHLTGGIRSDDLPTLDGGDNICLNTTLQQIEAMYVERALIKAGYNISKAGRFLNLSPQSMRYKIKKIGLRIPTE